jgi:FkbM family methyltransferase
MLAALKPALRKLRDLPPVHAALRGSLGAARALGLALPERVYRHVPFRGVATVDCGGGRTFAIRSGGHRQENGLYWAGLSAHEPGSMRRWLAAAASARTVLDIGANSGVFSLAAAAAGARRVHAFEPLARIRAVLEDNVALNAMQDRVSAWPVALGAQSGTATIFDPGGDVPTSASLSEDFVREHFGDGGHGLRYAVAVLAGDHFCEREGVDDVDLVKIDVEGFEAPVLAGLRGTLARCRPAVLMEVLGEPTPALQAQLDVLRAIGYRVERVVEGGAHPDRNVWLAADA